MKKFIGVLLGAVVLSISTITVTFAEGIMLPSLDSVYGKAQAPKTAVDLMNEFYALQQAEVKAKYAEPMAQLAILKGLEELKQTKANTLNESYDLDLESRALPVQIEGKRRTFVKEKSVNHTKQKGMIKKNNSNIKTRITSAATYSPFEQELLAQKLQQTSPKYLALQKELRQEMISAVRKKEGMLVRCMSVGADTIAAATHYINRKPGKSLFIFEIIHPTIGSLFYHARENETYSSIISKDPENTFMGNMDAMAFFADHKSYKYWLLCLKNMVIMG